MRGVPLKIAADPGDVATMVDVPGFESNAAGVDSELALLPIFGLPKGGFVLNPFYDERMTGQNRVGPEMAKTMILVTRLDGPEAGGCAEDDRRQHLRGEQPAGGAGGDRQPRPGPIRKAAIRWGMCGCATRGRCWCGTGGMWNLTRRRRCFRPPTCATRWRFISAGTRVAQTGRG